MRLAGAAKAVTVLSLALGLFPLAHVRQPLPQRFGGAPLRFRGALVYVSPTAVEVLEQNALVIGALLPQQNPELAGQLAAHAVGDEVEITTVPIQAFYDGGTRRSYLLKLDSWRSLGRPKPEQRQAAMDSRARLEPGNLLAPPPGAAARLPEPRPNALPEATRTALRSWIQSFPNYLADATERYEDAAIVAGRVRRDVLTYTATLADGKIARSNLTLDGVPWAGPYSATPVYHWDGGFGYMQAFIRPECGLRVEAGARGGAGSTEPVDGFSFTGPANGCLGDLYFGYETVFAPVHGTLWIARADRLPRRLEMIYDFPAAFTLHSMKLDIDWAPVTVAQRRYVLPSAASNAMEQEGEAGQSQITYANYHHFTASASIQFGGLASAAAVGAPAAPSLSGRWQATIPLGQQPPRPFGLLIRGDAQGGFSAQSSDGSGSQTQVRIEVAGNGVSFSVAEPEGPLVFHGVLNPARDTIQGTAAIGNQSFAMVLKRQPGDK